MSTTNNNLNQDDDNAVRAVPVLIPIEATNVNVITTDTISDKMKDCYAISKTVSCLAIIDGVISFIYALYNFWYFIPLLCAYSGYYGAKKFNNNFTLIYVFYLLFNTISRMILFIYICFNQSEISNFGYFVFISFVSIVVELWILKVVYHFYKMMKEFSLIDIQRLKEIKNLKYRVIYY